VSAQRRQYGLSLIELMISLLLAALVLLGVVVLFQQSKSTALQDEQVARMQENGRYALRVLSRELGMMNYFGGMIDVDPDPLVLSTNRLTIGTDCNTDWMIALATPIEFSDKDSGTDQVANPSYSCIANAQIAAGTDVVAIKRVGDLPVRSWDSDGNLVAGSVSLTAGTAYFFTNGTVAALYTAGGGTDTCTTCSVTVPQFSSNIRQYMPEIFFIRPNSSGSDGIPSLVRETLEGSSMQAQVLVEGVEDMQIEWGVDGTDTDLAPDYYTNNPDGAQLSRAVTARIFLLMRSVNPVTGYVNDKSYNLGSKVVAAKNDAFYRRVYATTVQLRNSEMLQMSSAE